MACSRCSSPLSRDLRAVYLVLGAIALSFAVACASSELPPRSANDPANPSAPEGVSPLSVTTASASAPAAHDAHSQGHEGHTMPMGTMSATPSDSAGQGHSHHGH